MIKMIVAGDSVGNQYCLIVDIFMKARKIIESAIIIVCSTNTGYLYHNQHITYDSAKRLLSTYRDCCNQQFEWL